jgi:hypothetical protein
MMEVSPTYLRFFFASCCFGIVIGVMGCATNNWSRPLFENPDAAEAEGNEGSGAKAPKSFWKQGFGDISGSDPRAREIERSLGF